MQNHNQINLGIAVFSSDPYSDFWEIFFDSWFRYSGLEMFPIYLITSTKTFQDKRVTVINAPELVLCSWSNRIKAGLMKIQHEYLLVVTEDLLCLKKIDEANLLNLIRFIKSTNCTCLRLVPDASLHPQMDGWEICRIFDWSMHRASLQMSIWKREALVELIKEGESPWEFEINGSQRSRSDENYFSTIYPVVPYLEVIGRGRITRRGVRLIRSRGLEDRIARPVFSRKEELIRNIGHLKARLFYALPIFLQKRLIRAGIVGRAFGDFKQQEGIGKN